MQKNTKVLYALRKTDIVMLRDALLQVMKIIFHSKQAFVRGLSALEYLSFADDYPLALEPEPTLTTVIVASHTVHNNVSETEDCTHALEQL